MHDIRAIRANPEPLKQALLRRQQPPAEVDSLLASLLALDEQYRTALTEKETLLARRNAASKEIGQAMAQKDMARAEALKAEVAAGKDRLAQLEGEAGTLEGQLRDMLSALPNIPLDEVPQGADEHGNVEHRRHLAVPNLAFAAKEHFDLGEALGMMDFETAAKLSGSRFVVLQKGLARLERALGQFMLDLHTGEHGYTEVQPPILVRDEAMYGTAQLPKFREDQFMVMSEGTRTELLSGALEHVSPGDAQVFREGLMPLAKLVERTLNRAPSREDRWLVPTAEVPLTNLVREKILLEEELPLRFTALTPCFRAEAGSAGRDTRGMLRQHQFNKVELVSITTPETSRQEHDRMLDCAETVLKKLGLHFRTMTLCTGDMGFASQKTYDIEVWLPGQNTYREISSCSVCGDFQARRMDARFRGAGDKATRFVHTLNGSGVAVGRCLIAVMENYQNPDGSITVPDVLKPYMGGLDRIERAA
ncbi:serine--tRNA ligase [Rhabdaerophilum sp. SD176]|uniref:serine--tRNA ligase n=1 Tax=Rhabdaerophilum sp. SD176 TaxID=2983548 RepID=UPI0024E0014B|nr:serine--tRNA ligase [Rhabdaerophilum sp. SD176]